MKNIFICLLFLFSGLYLTAQNPAELNKQFEFSADSKTQPTFNLDSLITACLADISADSIEKYMRELEGFGTRYQNDPNHKNVAEYLKEKFLSFGYTDVVLDSFVHITDYYFTDTTWQYNVVATRQGSVNEMTQYIVGSHYDSFIEEILTQPYCPWVPGADDNASGTAANIELARVMALHNIQAPSTIKFICFAAEEKMAMDTTLCGSGHYASSARLNGDDIAFYLNLDMISNVASNDSVVLVYHYSGSDYVFDVMMDAFVMYTGLSASVVDQELYCDGYKFWINGFESLTLFESDISPNIHQQSDSVGNCNIPYCTSVTKLACTAVLKGVFGTRPVRGLRVVAVNDCEDVQVDWLKSKDSMVDYYRVSIGTVPGNFDSTVVTSDTTCLFTNLTADIKYFFSVSAVCDSAIESIAVTDSVVPMNCSFNEGVLIVDGSDGGLGSPADEEIDDFYRQVLFGFQHTYYSADSAGRIDLSILGKYSSVFWHINSEVNAASFYNSYKAIESYLSSGGNLFLTAFKPAKTIGQHAGFGKTVYENHSFFHDFLKLAETQSSVYSYLNSAVPEMILFDTLHCDSSKTGGKMKFVEVLNPTSEAAELYWYDSPYDTTQNLGELKYKNVGVLYDGVDFKTLTLGFPLYYMNKDEVQSLLRYVFENIFGEVYTGIEENVTALNLQCNPNPVSDILYVKGAQGDTFTILDASGRIVRSGKTTSDGIDVSSLKPGIYTLRNESSAILFIKE